MDKNDCPNSISLSFPFAKKEVKGSVTLPFSKSESNRALMIAAYSGSALQIEHISDSHDTFLLKNNLQYIDNNITTINCEDAGTVARFLMTFLAFKKGEWILTGNGRLCQRPMGDLVDALRQLGAAIDYLEKDRCLPVKIKGTDIQGGEISLRVDKSSQFASSLLLAAPMWTNGLKLHLKGNLNSLPYIDMTIVMLRNAGAKCQRKGKVIVVENSPYHNEKQIVTSDWSAASYWFELAALSDDCDLLFENLSFDSLQGDAAVVEMMRLLGVEAVEVKNGIRLKKRQLSVENLVFDFSSTPDLFPAVVATCTGLNINARFIGVKNLVLKESDRVAAMTEELMKIGATLVRVSDDEVQLSFSEKLRFPNSQSIVFSSHNDHRIAMAIAPLAMKIGDLCISNPQVVEKSYPDFWQEMGKFVVLHWLS